MKHLPDVEFHVVSPKISVRSMLNNIKPYETGGYKDPFNPSLHGAINFAFRSYRYSKLIIKRRNIDIIHHFLPAQYPRVASFLPFDHSFVGKYPFVVGPIPFPTYWPRRGTDRLLDILAKPFFIRILGKADKIIVQTKALKKMCQLALPQKDKDIVVIPPGVDTDIFKPNPSRINRFEILTVANLLEKKGIQYLIPAISIIKKEFPNIILRIVGSGPYRQHLHSLTKKLELTSNVIFEGKVPNKDLVNLYNQAAVFCSPSVVEPFGVVILEAMACGKLIVATKTAGACETIRQGKNGLLARVANCRSLADSLVTLLRDPCLIKSMGEEARKACENKYSWVAIGRRYCELYESIVKDKK